MKKYVDRDMVCDSDEHCTNLNVWKAHKDKINTDKSLYMVRKFTDSYSDENYFVDNVNIKKYMFCLLLFFKM